MSSLGIDSSSIQLEVEAGDISRNPCKQHWLALLVSQLADDLHEVADAARVTARVRHVRLPPGAHPQLRVARVRQEVLEFCIRPPEHAAEPASIFVPCPP